MWHNYGYIEDDKGKIYDFRLLWRLSGYTRPYFALIVFTCVLIFAATVADLVLPYLTKLAIDRYIVVAAQKVDAAGIDSPQILDLLAKNKRYFKLTGRNGEYFLAPDQARAMDPMDLDKLTQAGIIKSELYYLVENMDGPARAVIEDHPGLFLVYPYLTAIPQADLSGLSPKELIRLRAGDISGLARIALVAVIFMVGGYLFHFAQVILLEYAGQRVTHDLRQELIGHVFNQAIAFHDKTTTGRLVARLTNDVQNLSEMIKNVAVTFFKDAFILMGIVGLLVYINWRLTLVTFVLLPPIFITTMLFRRKAREVFRVLRQKVAQINSTLGETIAGIRVIQAFRREKTNIRQFGQLNYENYLAGLRQVRVFAVFMPLIDVLAAIALGLIVWYGGLGVINEVMSLGAVVAFIGYVRKFFQPIRELAEKFNILQSAMASLERIFILLDTQAALPLARQAQLVEKTQGRIEFEHVFFEYEAGAPVLCDLSFQMEPGQTLAIVGATGAGKTSIINLLLRFYDVTGGRILVDGQDIRDLKPDAHRRRIGLVMQDVFLFSGSVKENIALARDDLSPVNIQEAARAVGAADFIEALPEGYDQKLGEGGLSLSVGQRQLLSLARALAQDPQILILDEATAFIDSETEKLIEKAIMRLTAGRTSIIIAHRLSTIRRADRILVLHHGRLVETGAHGELLTRRGLYFRLHELQHRENLLAKNSGP